MPTPSLEKAAKIAELSKKNGGVFVFATCDPSLVNQENASAEIAKYPFAEYSCVECGTHFHGVKADGISAHCVTCGSHKTKVLEESKPKIPQDSELAFVGCPSCGTNNILAEAHVHAVEGSFHCVICGTDLKTQAELEDPMDELDVPEVDDMELIDVDSDEETADTTMEAPSDSADAPLGTDPVDPVTVTQDLPSDKPSGEVPADEVNPGTTQQDPIDEKMLTADTDEMPMNDYSGDEVVVDMTDIEESPELSFVYRDTSLSLMGNNKIIATLTEEKAGDNASMMQTEEFRRALSHSIASLGLKRALAQYGFEVAKVRVPLSTVVRKKVEAAVKDETAALKKQREEVATDFEHSVVIAAAGFAGNFWRDRTDPLKLAIAAELKALNVRNATALVDKIFAAHGVSHLKAVIDLAKELNNKSAEARNALAGAIDLAKYQPMVVKASEDTEDETSDDEEEEDDTDVATIATPVETASVPPSKSMYRSPELRSILGDSENLFPM
jgi:DNA-directed RNA polymerase subunit RPC12/RpoP